jgi:uncharacterized protein YegJ (DUF2314 family)
MSAPSGKLEFNVGHWLTLACGLYLTVRGGTGIVRSPSGWLAWLALVIGLWMLIGESRRWFSVRREKKKEEEAESGPLRALVFLLTEPRKIEPGPWIAQIGDAVGVELNANGDEATSFIMPMPHPSIAAERGECFMLKIPQGAFWIFHMHQPYFTDMEETLDGIRDGRLRDAVATHTAWLSVDLVHWAGGDAERDEAYAMIGKIISALAGPDVCAVLSPELERCNEFDASHIERLRGGRPLEIFDEPTRAPVLDVQEGDPAMKAAIAEARRRLPEFEALFTRRTAAEDKPYIIKAPFTSGDDKEFIWVTVKAIADGTFTGHLLNQPLRLAGLEEGQEVIVDRDEIIDWLCPDEHGNALGGWTQAVLTGRPGKHLGEPG